MSKATGDSDLEVRRLVAKTLAFQLKTGPQAIPAIRGCLQDDDLEVRTTAVAALSLQGPAAASTVPELTALLGDKDKTLRGLTLKTLDRIGVEAVPAFARALKDPDVNLRHQAVRSLAKFGTAAKPALPELVDLLGDKANYVLDARRTVVNIGTEAFGPLTALLKQWNAALVPQLLPLVHDPDPSVRRAALNAIQQIDPDAVPKD